MSETMPLPPAGEGARAYQEPKKKKGCFFYGCLSLFVIAGLGGGIVAFGIYYARNQILKFTSTEPIAVQSYELKPGEYESLQQKVKDFSQAADKGESGKLEISGDDLNAFLAGSSETKSLVGKVHARIEGDQVLLDASFSLDDIPTLGGRYFNGTIGLKPTVVDHRLIVFPETATVNGEKLPERIMEQARNQDLLKNQRNQKGGLVEFLQKAKSLEVRDGKLLLSR